MFDEDAAEREAHQRAGQLRDGDAARRVEPSRRRVAHAEDGEGRELRVEVGGEVAFGLAGAHEVDPVLLVGRVSRKNWTELSHRRRNIPKFFHRHNVTPYNSLHQ